VTGVVFTLWLGAIGVVVATILAETLRYVGLAAYLRREQPTFSLFPRTLIAQLFSGLCMAAVLIILETTIQINSWLVLGGLVGGGAAVYFAVLFTVSHRFRETVFGTLDDMYPAWRNRIGYD
jgi:phage-related protein